MRKEEETKINNRSLIVCDYHCDRGREMDRERLCVKEREIEREREEEDTIR